MAEESRKRALALLDRRDYSRRELVRKLTEKGVDPAEAEAVAEDFQRLGLIDDGRYAALLVRHYAGKGYGPGRIRTELSRRGIDRDLWDEALSQLPEQEEQVYRLLCSRLRDAGADRASVKKATDALFRRGYSWDEIRAAVERYTTEMEGMS